ncbi:hypothetical protein QQF64_034208 [Cirrhinus molitorella]|uniref:Reverse transcriptase/retrotransposon-derived protein RNase H-like domain-containing protein n=1 Tax=Cirrhinus molitorella TaxID=172907 RepID=A0ABR3MW67_9TELE
MEQLGVISRVEEPTEWCAGIVVVPKKSDSGVQPDPAKTAAVQEMPESSNISELRSFLGMVNQLGKFIPHLAEKDKPLRKLLSKKNCWLWGEAQVKAFQDLKKDLSSTPVLALYDPKKPIKLSIELSCTTRRSQSKFSADASSLGLGTVLLQQEETTADTLSRTPLPAVKGNIDEELMDSTNIYVDNIMEQFPASQSFLDNLRELLKLDSVCSSIMKMCQDRWPESGRCTGDEKLYWPERAYLSVHDGLFLKGLCTQDALFPDVLHSGAGTPRAAAEDVSQAPIACVEDSDHA